MKSEYELLLQFAEYVVMFLQQMKLAIDFYKEFLFHDRNTLREFNITRRFSTFETID